MVEPTITEIWAEPGVGKTHQAHDGWPNPLHLDTAWVQYGFGTVDTKENERMKGESWSVVRKLYESEAEAKNHYEYLSKPEEIDVGDFDTVIIDNVTDLRGLFAQQVLSEIDKDRLAQRHWGDIKIRLKTFIQDLHAQGVHIVLVSKLSDEYIDDSKTGNRKPKAGFDADYMSDFRVELTLGNGERQANIRKNRYADPVSFGGWPVNIGSEVSLESLFQIAGVDYE